MIHQSPAASFTLPTEFAMHDLPAQIGSGYVVVEAEKEQFDEEYLDTFDWRLYTNGKALSRTGRRYRLYSAVGEVLCQGKGPGKTHPFWRDFQPGQLQDELKSVADIRALCPQLLLRSTRQHFHLLNSDEKIVLKLRQDLTAIVLGKEPTHIFSLQLQGIRGYSKPFAAVVQIVGRNGGQQNAEGSFFLAPVLEAAGISPEKMAARFSIALEHDISVYEGLCEVGLALLADIQMQRPGVIEDIDSEYLHDFRIALRRKRSLLSLYHKILPAQQADHFRAEFKWLTLATGQVRDNDVYLLEADNFRAMLPARLHPGLNCFFQGLSELRKREFKLMRRRFKSPRAAKLLKDWQVFLEGQLPEMHTSNGKRLGRQFAARVLKKRYKKILEAGAACGPQSPDRTLHALRIEAKKLRYLLEFFRSLFPVSEVDLLVKHLKRLQNNLGEFNDLSVQQTMLGSYQSPVKTDNLEQMLSVAASLGGLITHLADRQNQVRGEFEGIFLEFSGEDTQNLVRTIVGDAVHDLPPKKDLPST